MEKKHWRMMGETTANRREENELLNDMPDFQIKARPKLQVDQELNKQIDEIVKQRIADKNFDNPVYETQQEQKELADVSTEKDQKGLGEILNKTGIRTEVSDAVIKQRRLCMELMNDVETELRSYFVNGTYGK